MISFKSVLTYIKKLIRFFASVKCAVLILSYIAVVIAIGTFVESSYDAYAAKKWIYDTFWMYLGMGLLSMSLIAVMVDRWPWQKKHTPFLFAHVGILVILLGSFITLKWGLDGSLTIPIGKNNRFAIVPNTDIVVYATYDGKKLAKIHEREVDFFRQDVKKNPLELPLDEGSLKFVDFHRYVVPVKQVLPSESLQAGAGLRFQMQNKQAHVIEWLVQRNPGTQAVHDLGPAQVYLQPEGDTSMVVGPAVVLHPQSEGVKYKVIGKDHKQMDQGFLREGEFFVTPWMASQFRILRYMPKAVEKWDIEPRDRPTPQTLSAVKMIYAGQEYWVLLNDTLRLFTEKTAYYVSFIQRRIDLGFDFTLKTFTQENYQGTQKAKEYKSVVQFPGQPEQVISMNEPLNYNGLTFYQASFQQGPTGIPTASVFSVNYDPGRALKYAGSLIMSLGILFLFYFRKYYSRR